MGISFVIVNYKSEQMLKECVRSIFDNACGMNFEVIVSNNDEKKLDDFGFNKEKNVRVIETGSNVGFGKACNIGAKDAKFQILCFLNPDTKIASKKISEKLTCFDSNQKIGVLGPMIMEMNGRTQKWSIGKAPSISQIIKNKLGLVDDFQDNEIDWVTGAAMFVRKDVFEKAKGFDENFFMYFEDVDLCVRIKNLGFEIAYSPAITIYHVGGGSFSENNKQKRYYYDSQDYYFKKHYGDAYQRAVKILRYLGNLLDKLNNR